MNSASAITVSQNSRSRSADVSRRRRAATTPQPIAAAMMSHWTIPTWNDIRSAEPRSDGP